jgi:ribosome biogenesis GTPase
VRLSFDDTAVANNESADASDGGGAVIAELLPRKNALIRPPMANLDILLITVAAAEPAPVPETVDKLISIAEFNDIAPVLIIGKCDLAPDTAEELKRVYELAGYPVFLLSATEGAGVDALRTYLACELVGKTAAFAGASGVGKSTLLGALFPDLKPETGEISRKISRGKHTTRRVQLYPLDGIENAHLADTPGFSMLDFVRFDFFTKEDLPLTMREFQPYLGECRYTKCTHTKDEGCVILDAMREGRIAQSRHQSYLAMYEALKNKHEWSKK